MDGLPEDPRGRAGVCKRQRFLSTGALNALERAAIANGSRLGHLTARRLPIARLHDGPTGAGRRIRGDCVWVNAADCTALDSPSSDGRSSERPLERGDAVNDRIYKVRFTELQSALAVAAARTKAHSLFLSAPNASQRVISTFRITNNGFRKRRLRW